MWIVKTQRKEMTMQIKGEISDKQNAYFNQQAQQC